MNNGFLINTSLQLENRSLKREIKLFKTGEHYQKLQGGYRRLIQGYRKRIAALEKEVLEANKRTESVRDMWYEQCVSDWEEYQAELKKKDELIRKLKEKLRELMTKSDGDITSVKQTYTEEIAELMAVIKAQEEKIAHLEALQQRDSTNTNLPTGQTPPGRNKHIPNSRRNTGKPRGGQVGHEQHTLAAPAEDEITEEVDHFVERDEVCPKCGSDNYTYTGKYEDRYVTDIEIIIHRIRHKYWIVRCNDCGEEFHTEIAPDLRAKCQYGPNIG